MQTKAIKPLCHLSPIFFVIFLFIALSTHSQANTLNPKLEINNPEPESINESNAGDIEFSFDNGNAITHMRGLHLSSKANISINGLLATVEIEQQFQNASSHWVEGRYVFPLPDNAAVNFMEMHIGERVIKAEIKEKQEAKAIYQAAKNSGKKTALLEQHRANLFSQQIANIAPNETVVIRLRYIQDIEYEHNKFSLRFPMTMTPRYFPGKTLTNNNQTEISSEDSNATIIKSNIKKNTESNIKNIKIATESNWGWATATDQVSDADLISPPMINNDQSEEHPVNSIELSISLDAGLPLASIDSAYHAITRSKNIDSYNITPAQGLISMDRDFFLSWQTTASQTPQAAFFNEAINNKTLDNGTFDTNHYSLIMLMPPTQKHNNIESSDTIHKDITFIIDTSGSMGGTSIKQAKAGLIFALKQLKPEDNFNIIEFNSTYSLFQTKTVAASSINIANALSFVNNLQANGGTEMYGALLKALSQDYDDNRLKQIIFITDGSIANEDQLFKLINEKLSNARLFTVGIGSAPNSFFMRKAAEIGRGSFTYIGDVNEVTDKIRSLFSKINYPTIRDLVITDYAGQALDVFPNPLPDLYHGEPVVAAIRHQNKIKNLTISGVYLNTPWEKNLSINIDKNHNGISSLWARKKIESLLDTKRYTVNDDKKNTIKNQVIKLALRHQLMSPYTSFIAVEQQQSRSDESPLSSEAIPNLIPQGQTLQSVQYPQTSTSLWLNLILGFVSLLASLLSYKVKKYGSLKVKNNE